MNNIPHIPQDHWIDIVIKGLQSDNRGLHLEDEDDYFDYYSSDNNCGGVCVDCLDSCNQDATPPQGMIIGHTKSIYVGGNMSSSKPEVKSAEVVDYMKIIRDISRG